MSYMVIDASTINAFSRDGAVDLRGVVTPFDVAQTTGPSCSTRRCRSR